MNNLACLPPAAASANKSFTAIHGLNAAVEALCRPTHLQHQHRTALVADEPLQVSNCGRIICLTTLKRFVKRRQLLNLHGDIFGKLMNFSYLHLFTEFQVLRNLRELHARNNDDDDVY